MRQMFADPKVEAVSIATPNHWHALATIWALPGGQGRLRRKARLLQHLRRPADDRGGARDQAHRAGRLAASQHRRTRSRRSQRCSEGVIGKVYLAKGLCYKRRPSIGHAADSPTPPGVNWDLFLGPAPMRPFNEMRFNYNWHWFWDTGNGDIGNQGVHEMDIAAGVWAIRSGRRPPSRTAASTPTTTIRRRPTRCSPASTMASARSCSKCAAC